jgi:hypothetical protein
MSVKYRGNMGFEGEWDESLDEDQYVPLYVPIEYRRLEAREGNMTVRELWDRYCNEDLILQPDFQRNYVWDNSKASRYIESLMLGLPTPAIFLSEEPDNKWIVIDGHQRLESLFRYMQPLLSGPRQAMKKNVRLPYGALTPLGLTGLEVLSEINGTGIESLAVEDREKLWETPLSVIELPKTAHPDMKYVLFSRLNQGSMSLNPQELRNCLYRGAYNQLIARLSESNAFLSLWGRSTPDKRMKHRELVLRVFAMLHRRDKYRIPFRAFLGDEMEACRNLSRQDIDGYRQQFERAVTWVERIFGNEVFRQFQMGNDNNPAGQWGRRRYDLVYEVEMVGFAQFGEQLDQFWKTAAAKEQQMLPLITRNKLAAVMTSDKFIDSINQGTTRVSAVNARFEAWLKTMESITQDFRSAIQEGDLISRTLGESSVCALCPYPLSSEDAVWVSVDADRKLAHRFCEQRRQKRP